MILVDDSNNIIFDTYSLRFEDFIDFDEHKKYRQEHFWEIEDGTFA